MESSILEPRSFYLNAFKHFFKVFGPIEDVGKPFPGIFNLQSSAGKLLFKKLLNAFLKAFGLIEDVGKPFLGIFNLQSSVGKIILKSFKAF